MLLAATSASVGVRWSSALEDAAYARSTSRALDRTDRGIQSIAAQLVDDRAADPVDGVRLELDLALEVELLDRVDEPEDAVRDEVGLLDVRRQTHTHAAGDVLDERRVVKDQPLAQGLLAGLLELGPQGLEGGVGVSGLGLLVRLLGGSQQRVGSRFGSRGVHGDGQVLGNSLGHCVLGRVVLCDVDLVLRVGVVGDDGIHRCAVGALTRGGAPGHT